MQLTIRISLDYKHATKLPYTQTSNLFPLSGSFGTLEYAALYDTIDALIQERHSRCSLDDFGEWREQFLD